MSDFILKDVRLSFPVLWEPREYQEGDGKPRWSAVFLIPPGSDNDKLVRNAIKAAADEVFKNRADAMLKSFEGNALKMCYQDGSKKTYDGYAGMWYLSCHRAVKTKSGRNHPPKIIDLSKRDVTEESGLIYAGCYVNAKVAIWAQSGANAGIRGSFSVIQFNRKGDAFGAAAPTAADMEDLSDQAEPDLGDTDGLV